jgi:hypothetical protein
MKKWIKGFIGNKLTPLSAQKTLGAVQTASNMLTHEVISPASPPPIAAASAQAALLKETAEENKHMAQAIQELLSQQ